MAAPNPNSKPTNSKIKNALKSAARLPVRRRRRTAALTPASGSGSGSSSSSDEAPGVTDARSISASVTPTTATPVRTAKSNHLKRGLRVSRLGLGFGLNRKGKGLSNGSGRNTLRPIQGETPWVFLRVQVVGCTDLLAKDRNGFSDPFASVSLPPHPTRHTTPVSKRTLNPSFPPLLSTFDFPIFRSLADRLGVLEIVLWDKDFFGLGAGGKGGVGVGRKEYLGEAAIGLERWFDMNGGRAVPWSPDSETGNGLEFELPLVSARSNTHARGKVKLRLGFVRGDGSAETEQDLFDEVYEELLSRSRPSLVNIPPTQGVGTVRSHRSQNDVPLPLVAPITDNQHPSVHAPSTSSAYSTNPNFGGSTRTVTSASVGIPPEVLSGYQDLYSAYSTYGTDGAYEDDGGLSSEDEGGFTEAESESEDAQEGEGRVELEEEEEEEEEGDSEYEEVEVEVSDFGSESESESESDWEYSEHDEEQDAYSGEENLDIQTPTLSPTDTIVPNGASPMTTPTAPASGSHPHPPPSSFSALYENQSSAKPPARHNTIRRASAPAHAAAASTSAPISPSHSPSPVDLVIVEAPSPVSGPIDIQTKLTSKSRTQQRDGRNAPPPALNLTPASPEIVAPIPIPLSSPLSQALSASPTSSLGPQIRTEAGVVEGGPVGIGMGAPTSSPSRSRFRLSPIRAATAPSSIPPSPTKLTFTPTASSRSSILPRIPLPGISGIPKPRMPNPLRRNTSPGVNVTAPSTPTGAEFTQSSTGTMPVVYDLTEDLAVPLPSGSNQNRRPSLTPSQPPTSTSNGNVTDPGLDNTESLNTKKSRFRKSWSGVGVRRPRDRDKEREASSGSSASASTPGSGVGGSDYMMYANVDPVDTVNMDAATQAMMGGVVGPPGTGGAGAVSGVKTRKKIGIKKRKKEIVPVGGSEIIEGEEGGGGGRKSKVAKTKMIKVKKMKVKKVKDKGKGKEQENLTPRKRPRLVPRRTRPSYRLGPSGVGGSSNNNGGVGGNDVSGYGDGDIVGIVMVEIEKAEDLPRLRNITRTGWDMDPFVVISFGKKVFRTRVIRHSLNPVWDEKLLFHVRRYETGFKVQLTILDWDKLSSNDYIGECDFGVAELIEAFESGRGGVDPETGLYPLNYDSSAGTENGGSGMKEFRLPLKTAKEMPWEAKHRPVVTFRAKYQPYAALRQRFWFQYLKQYDTDDTGMISHLELTSMLDSLGSTLSWETVMGFWTRFGKNPHGNVPGEGEELTMAEAIQCLETELGRPEREKRWVGGGAEGDSGASTDTSTYGYGYGYGSGGGAGEGGDDSSTSVSVGATPVLMLADRRGHELSLDQLDFSGPPLSAMVSPGMFQDGNEEFFERDRVPAVKGHGGVDGNSMMRLSVGGGTGSSSSGSGSLSSSGLGYGLDSYSSFDGEKLNLMEYPASASAFGFGSNGNNGNGVDNGTSKFSLRPGPSPGSLPPPPPVSASSTITPANIRSNSVTFSPPPSATSMTFSHSYSSTTSTSSTPSTLLQSPSAPSVSATSTHFVERVINVQTCPLCHRPRLSAKAEVDIVTHLAICASQDWNKVDRIMVGNFVTASQAQRKWYTRVIGKMSSGNYKLGANSANIIVQNRMTGQLEEEKMQVYVRLGIRLLYKGMKSRMEGSRARRLLKSLSIKQGVKYDSPESVRDILPFIQFHKLDMNEVRDPVGSFKTFNQFFYRKLKPDARPVDSPSDSYRLVSAADCRFMAFESVNEATRLWIKGREFSVARLLGDAYKAEADRYNGGALAIFRLAPQDYHRFHSPVDGRIGKMTYISGEYYTVNPQAIRTALDVYGENARKIVPIDSPQFGRVMAVCVGAMMVGTIHTTVEEGQLVKRGEEFGYFAFGGSTIVLLFERGALEWDEDLVINGRAALETLVKVGMGLGTGLRKGQGNITRTPTPGY